MVRFEPSEELPGVKSLHSQKSSIQVAQHVVDDNQFLGFSTVLERSYKLHNSLEQVVEMLLDLQRVEGRRFAGRHLVHR